MGGVALRGASGRGGRMQIRHRLFRREDGCPQPQCQGRLHRHGFYSRYADPDGQERFKVPRYCCTHCRLTTSVLEDDRLPYRSVRAPELEAAFDRKSQVGDASPPTPLSPPVSEKKSGCFDRAWTAWNRNSRHIAALFGHLLSRRASEEAVQCWRSLRKTFSLEPMLARLGRDFKTSLLRDYLCLQPGRARPLA
jgi:hypothetical protein